MASATVAFAAFAPSARADDAAALEQVHDESLASRRLLADVVLGVGLGSIAAGAALMVPSGDDLAWRFAGVNTAVFGVIDTAVALYALHGIGGEERTWNASAAERRASPEGLAKARLHAAADERRESVGHAVNLGLDFGYLAVGIVMGAASQLGVDHPNRWLASGIAVGAESLPLVLVDVVGLGQSAKYHEGFLGGFAPLANVTRGGATFGVGARF